MFSIHWWACKCWNFTAPLAEETFSHFICSPPLLKINQLYRCGFVSGLAPLFHWPTCLFLYQYYTILITAALQYCLKSGSRISFTQCSPQNLDVSVCLSAQGILVQHHPIEIKWKSHFNVKLSSGLTKGSELKQVKLKVILILLNPKYQENYQ